ncbi:MAG: hypothetical protein GY940_38125, partial [bacterium]|nr:hypothetical protein [bacterium]
MNGTRIFFLLFSLFMVFPPSIYGDISSEEREALIALYTDTNGASWHNKTNWGSDPGTENTWYGITVQNDHVT